MARAIRCGDCGKSTILDNGTCSNCSPLSAAEVHRPLTTSQNYQANVSHSNSNSGLSNISVDIAGSGYTWVWFGSTKAIRRAYNKAESELRSEASRNGIRHIEDIRPALTYFPGFLFFRGCGVLLTAHGKRG